MENIGWIFYSVILFLIVGAIIIGFAIFYSSKRPGDFCETECGNMSCQLNKCKVNTGDDCNLSSDCVSGDLCTSSTCVTIGP